MSKINVMADRVDNYRQVINSYKYGRVINNKRSYYGRVKTMFSLDRVGWILGDCVYTYDTSSQQFYCTRFIRESEATILKRDVRELSHQKASLQHNLAVAEEAYATAVAKLKDLEE